MDLSSIFIWLFPGHSLSDVLGVLSNLWQVAILAIPISLLMYIMTQKYNHYILVDTGNHKWLIK
jgi:hypothetical protein